MIRMRRKNNVPFFILFLIHTSLLGIAFYKNKNRKKLFVLLVSNMGFAYLFEYIVFNLFKAYKYKPRALQNKSLDNIFGAVLSQAIFIPFTAVYLTVSKSGWSAKMFGSFYFSLVENLFLQLGLYKHNWWKTEYTLIFVPFYFKWSDLWNKHIVKNNPIVQFISFFLMIMVTETNLFLILATYHKFRFGIGRYHSWTEHFILSPIYSISLSLFTAYSLRKRHKMGAKLKVIIFAACLNKFFVRIKLLKNNLHVINYFLIRIVMVFIYDQYRKWVYEESKEGALKAKS